MFRKTQEGPATAATVSGDANVSAPVPFADRSGLGGDLALGGAARARTP